MAITMDRSSKNIVSIVAGLTQPLEIAIIRQLLQRDALVIVPASNADTILQIKSEVADISTGSLVTLVTDPMDYERSKEITDHIQSNYGRIDLVIILSCTTYPTLPLTELDYVTWDTMQCDSMSYWFMSARLVLPLMKRHRRGTFIQICNDPVQKMGAPSPLGRIASLLQMELSKELDREVGVYGVYYYHIFSHPEDEDVDRAKEAAYILGLYQDNVNQTRSLFHTASNHLLTNTIY
ncbi:SDR family NAD(P)-dependent oxidoreductase [Fulvivirgaceae bacterium PWU5]|uniref:SDR family NAD(P)-dependent oxidoreductase n=1 Tax=Dawidia cretensis TaxID=2782350 RepID=A0AAP2E1F7_9BACT|nr:SDR family NAD(P)-dependent oxidoreductase [Dawidia cretensis]MBT1710304.1 SDR family NAD(P)-dependent oxidoreductase [Dawidia cretensis]